MICACRGAFARLLIKDVGSRMGAKTELLSTGVHVGRLIKLKGPCSFAVWQEVSCENLDN